MIDGIGFFEESRELSFDCWLDLEGVVRLEESDESRGRKREAEVTDGVREYEAKCPGVDSLDSKNGRERDGSAEIGGLSMLSNVVVENCSSKISKRIISEKYVKTTRKKE